MKRVVELLQFGASELEKARVAEYELDARLLLQACTGLSRSDFLLDGDHEVSRQIREKYFRYLDRRKKREPVAYILGEQEFWSLPFHVSPSVLIPRSETEFLLDRVFALTDPRNFDRGKMLDLCCGSGVIGSVLAKERTRRVYGLDISFKALQVARLNILRHDLGGLVELIQGHLLAPFVNDRCFSLIVSNPPYVSRLDVAQNLDPEVALYEPHLALDGGDEGLELIREIWNGLPDVLCDGGQFFMEIGADQGDAVKKMFCQRPIGCAKCQLVDIIKDYSGRDRVLHVMM